MAIRASDFFRRFPDQVLKGLGQVMLQENRWTGLFFLLGLFSGGWVPGLAALLGAVAGTATAKVLKYAPEETDAGLYGFSPVLVGVALVTFFQAGPLVWLLVVVGGILAAALQHQFLVRRVPAFTFPFILVAWAFIFALRQAGLPAPVIMSAPAGMWSGWWTATNGYGQVIFQGGILAGFLFFLGVFVADSRAALFGLGASVLGAIAAVLLGQPMEMAHAGLFGFNAVLTAIALAGKKYRDLPWMLAGVLLTIALHLGLVESGLLDALGGVLTFPFVVGTWLILGARRAVGK